MSRKYRKIRLPATGEALMLLAETKSGWVVKVPGLTNRDHLTLVRESGGVGKHLTDERDKSDRRHVRVGKITKDTPRPEMSFYKDHAVALGDDDEFYAFDFAALLGGSGPSASNIPATGLAVDPAMVAEFRTADLSTISAFRRTTVGAARRAGFVAGLRRVGSENMAILRLSSGQLIQLSLLDFFGAGAETARVVGVGDLMGRAKDRRTKGESI